MNDIRREECNKRREDLQKYLDKQLKQLKKKHKFENKSYQNYMKLKHDLLDK